MDLKKIPHVNIIYKRFPFDGNFRIFNKKMVKVAESIKSKYIYQIANDDFLVLLYLCLGS